MPPCCGSRKTRLPDARPTGGLGKPALAPEKYIALTVDCNAAYVYLDPYEGGKIAVAEAARNLACSGAVPLGVTDNLNFGNPHNPEIFWQLRESVRGLAEGCRAFNAPVTGGNVSLYNQSPDWPDRSRRRRWRWSGLIEKPEHITTQWFKDEGDAIMLLGERVDGDDPLLGLGGSAYLQLRARPQDRHAAALRPGTEKELHLRLARADPFRRGQERPRLQRRRPGAWRWPRCCISQQVARETPRLIGASVDLSGISCQRTDALLFGETQGRVVITTSARDAVKTLERAKLLGLEAIRLGSVGGETLKIKMPVSEIACPVAALHETWWNSIARIMKD